MRPYDHTISKATIIKVMKICWILNAFLIFWKYYFVKIASRMNAGKQFRTLSYLCHSNLIQALSVASRFDDGPIKLPPRIDKVRQTKPRTFHQIPPPSFFLVSFYFSWDDIDSCFWCFLLSSIYAVFCCSLSSELSLSISNAVTLDLPNFYPDDPES